MIGLISFSLPVPIMRVMRRDHINDSDKVVICSKGKSMLDED